MDRSLAIESYVKSDPAIRKCPPEDIARLISVIDLLELDESDEVYAESSPATHVYYVADGIIEVKTSDKKSQRAESGQYFGQEAALGAPVYLDKAVAATKVSLLRIPAQDFARILDRRSDMRSEIFFSLLKELRLTAPFAVKSAAEPPVETSSFLTNFRLLLGWGLALSLPIIIYLTTAGRVNSSSAQVYVSLLMSGIIMWIFELVDSYIVGIFLVVTALVLRLAPAEVILSGYSSATFFMALGIFGLGSILVNSGILYRLLLNILRRIPGTQFWSNVSIFLLGMTMTMAVPVASNRVEVIAPFLNEFISQTKIRSQSNSATKLALCAFFSISIFSPIFLSGSLHNFMLLGLLWAQDQERFQWIGWLEAAAFTGVILLVGFALPLFFILKSDEKLNIDRSKIADQLRVLGPISRIEKFAITCFTIFAVGMLTQSLHRLPPQLIGLFILFALLVLEILTRENFRSLINWPALFLLGSLIGLINFFNYARLNLFIVDKLGWLGWYVKHDLYLFIFFLILVISLVRLFIPYGPTVVLLGTVFIPLAQQYQVNPWTVGFLVLLVGKMWFFPAQYPPYQEFCRLTSKEWTFNKKTILLYNVYMDLVKILAIFISIPYWRMLGVL